MRCGLTTLCDRRVVGADWMRRGLWRRLDCGRRGEETGETQRSDCRARQVPSRPSPDGGGVGENARALAKCDRVRYLRPSQGTADGKNMAMMELG